MISAPFVYLKYAFSLLHESVLPNRCGSSYPDRVPSLRRTYAFLVYTGWQRCSGSSAPLHLLLQLQSIDLRLLVLRQGLATFPTDDCSWLCPLRKSGRCRGSCLRILCSLPLGLRGMPGGAGRNLQPVQKCQADCID